MEKGNIIQIIPAPADMLLRYRDIDDNSEMERWRPLCLALVQYEDGANEVRILDVEKYGVIEFADDARNFDGVDWKEDTK